MAQYTHSLETDPNTGQPAFKLALDTGDAATATSIAFAPQQGSNLYSFVVGGTEYMFGPTVMGGQTRLLGSPILYPMPNRVRNATFTFDGRVFTFPANERTHFIHGLVQRAPWEVDQPTSDDLGASVRTHIHCTPGTAFFERFPIRNSLELVYRVEPRTLHMDFTVTNDDPVYRLPFGLAIHPYFVIPNGRESVTIQVPATHWMEHEALMPSGRLIPIDQGPADIRQETPLSKLNLDDVFFGLQRAHPQVIRYLDTKKRLTLYGDDFFTHSVVFTPNERPFFCIENQSCSTDAHNLYAQGLQESAHLTILEPGETLSARITFQVSDL
ncbi:MAG: aldose 1-epimerase [Anaerolineae bacterium]|jgi:aldose 1-epimerase|nr:aldose 1-epimerase [Chloroflexota bacterium]